MEALKQLAPRKVLGAFDFNAAPPLPKDIRNDLNDLSEADNRAKSSVNSLSKGRLLITSGPVEDAKASVSVEGNVAPLDLSLKMLARFTSSDSFHWCVHTLYVFTLCYYLASILARTIGATLVFVSVV